MAFKMRSGNKTVFKKMGSSPVKQTNEDTTLPDADPTQTATYEKMHNKKLEAELAALKASKDNSEQDRSDRILSGEATDQDRAVQKVKRQERVDMTKTAPWSQTVKDKHKYADAEGENTKTDRYDKEGNYIDTEQDTTAGERRAANRARREASKSAFDKYKTENPDATGKEKRAFKKNQRYNNKTAKLKAKYDSAQAKGTQGLRFNWKNMFLGGVEDAFEVDSRKNILADKIKKRDRKKINKAKVKANNKKTKEDKEKRKPGTVLSRTIKKLKKK